MGWGMVSDSRHRQQLCSKPGNPLKMDEQMEDVLTAVSVLALRDVHTDPRVLDSLWEKQAVSYFPVTKGGVLTGFGSLQNHCITKIKHCHSSVVKFLSFVSWKAGAVSYCWQGEEEERLRLKACICIEKQGALGRELFQGQEPGWFCALPFGCSVPRARTPVASGRWSVSSPAAQDRSLSMQRLWLFWQLYTKFIWK